jgi:hypothetical protein
MLDQQKSRMRTAVAIAAFLGACGGLSTSAVVADMGAMGAIAISSPKDGSTVSAGGENKMEYEITLGSGDDHFHVWVDGEKSPPQRALKGSLVLPKMTAGKHAIIVKIVDKAHVPTGMEKSVFVKAE